MKEYWLKIKESLMQAIEPKDIRIFVKLLMIWIIAFLYLKLLGLFIRTLYSIYLMIFANDSYNSVIEIISERLSNL